MILKLFLIFQFVFICESRIPANEDEFSQIEKLKNELGNLDEMDKESRDLKIVKTNEDPKEFKKYLQEYLNVVPDGVILNWIRYYDNNLDQAKENLLKNIEWRRKAHVDKLKDWKIPDYLVENFPFKITGQMKDGRPVWYVPFGKYNVRKAISLGHGEDLVKWGVKLYENLITDFNEKAKTINETTGLVPPEGVSSGVVIIDLEGFSIVDVTSLRTLNFGRKIIQVNEAYYPMTIDNLLMINAPFYFSTGFNVVKQFFSSKTLDGLEIFGSVKDEWEPVLHKYIPEELIPKNLLNS